MSSIHALYLNHSGKACVKRWPLDFEIRLGDLIYLSSGPPPHSRGWKFRADTYILGESGVMELQSLR